MAYRGFLKLKRFVLRHQRFAGGWCGELMRERVEGRHAVSVLLYDAVADALVLIEQFRIGAVGHAASPWLLETVGGYLEENEQAEQVARRETLEETGCELLEMECVGQFFTSPGWSGERITLFCGRVDSRHAQGIHGLDSEGEDIRVVVLPWEQAKAELFKRADSTSIIIGLQWLMNERKRLRSIWG